MEYLVELRNKNGKAIRFGSVTYKSLDQAYQVLLSIIIMHVDTEARIVNEGEAIVYDWIDYEIMLEKNSSYQNEARNRRKIVKD